MEFGKRHNTTDTTDFARSKLLRTCYGQPTGKVRGNWCNEFWPLAPMPTGSQLHWPPKECLIIGLRCHRII